MVLLQVQSSTPSRYVEPHPLAGCCNTHALAAYTLCEAQALLQFSKAFGNCHWLLALGTGWQHPRHRTPHMNHAAVMHAIYVALPTLQSPVTLWLQLVAATTLGMCLSNPDSACDSAAFWLAAGDGCKGQRRLLQHHRRHPVVSIDLVSPCPAGSSCPANTIARSCHHGYYSSAVWLPS